MKSRHLVTLSLFLVLAAVPALLAPRGGQARPDDESAAADEIPENVVEALRRGRYWRANVAS